MSFTHFTREEVVLTTETVSARKSHSFRQESTTLKDPEERTRENSKWKLNVNKSNRATSVYSKLEEMTHARNMLDFYC